MEKAARLVQRGELDRALKAYVRLFEQDRRDWSVGNTLGDLYVRVGQSKEAIAHFASLAEQLAKDGFEAKARALYRKILRIQPDNAIARQRVDELDRQQGGSVSPFLKRVLETARASRETAEAEEAPAEAPTLTPAPAAPPIPAPMAQPPIPVSTTQPPTPVSTAQPPIPVSTAQPPIPVSTAQPPIPVFTAQPPRPAPQSRAPEPRPPEPLPVPEPPRAREPEIDASFLSMPDSPEAIFSTPPPAPEAPKPPVVGLPATSAEWEDEWAAVVPGPHHEAAPQEDPHEEHEHEISLNDSLLDVEEESETDAFARVQSTADAAASRHDYRAAFETIEQFLVGHPNHIVALEKLVEIGVDAGFDIELQSAQLRLVKECVEAERYRQAWEAAADLVIRHPSDARYRELLDRVGTVARAHGFTFPAVPEFDQDASDVAAARPQPVAPTPALHLVPPPQPQLQVELEAQPPVDAHAAQAPSAPVHAAAAVPEPARIEPGACNDELLREWSDVDLTFDTIRNALLDEAAAGAEEQLAEAAKYIQARQTDDAIRALEEAMCAPHLRVTAGAKLAQLYRANDAPMDALACLEWIAEMPPATEEAGHELAYELAVTLEALGQEAQALGVYRELLAEVGPGYRDIASRVEKLAAA